MEIKWDEVLLLPEEAQVDEINKYIGTFPKGTKLYEISEALGLSKSEISNHFSKMGYKYIDRKYVKKENNSNKSSQSQEKLIDDELKNLKQIELFLDIKNLKESECQTKSKKITVKLSSQVKDELDKVVLEESLFSQADIVNVALSRFFKEYLGDN